MNTENDLPSEFALLSPTNESMVTELMPSFYWEEPTDADFNGSIVRYDFYLNTSNSFTGIDPIELTSNDYVYSAGLNEDQLYYWKVVAVDNSGGQTVSECWSFYTNSENSAPSEFALLTPSANEETGLLPTFNWSESTDPDLYDELSYTFELWIRSIKYDQCNSSFNKSQSF